MSASLVGSEMCIRDREKAPPPPSATPKPAELSGPPAKAGGTPSVETEVPVSYTHLTLPTICSV
eukprot:14132443-Alexandrium_andersonii.AAC.1